MAAASVETLASDMKAMFLDQAKRAEMIVCQLKRRRPEDAQAIYKVYVDITSTSGMSSDSKHTLSVSSHQYMSFM
jgi:hypothetical protein